MNFDGFNDSSCGKGFTTQTESSVILKTMSLQEVFALKLRIPNYQRIYCWPQKNVELLLDDIFVPRGHKYHLGTLILQKKDDGYEN